MSNVAQVTNLPILPLEIALSILREAPDTQTLRNMIISAPYFYHGFHLASKMILESVLMNEYGPYLLPEALATYASSRLSQPGFESARDQLLSDLVAIPRIPEGWTIADSLALNQIYHHVEYFATKFAATCFHSSEESSVMDDQPMTRNEMRRIRSALFRFELYCNLYRRSPNRPRCDERKGTFLDKFSPWENEQLFTIYEFLRRGLSIAFDEIADHDVLWGKICTGFDSQYKSNHLSHGLGWLRRLDSAVTYSERYQLLIPEIDEYDHDFLGETFDQSQEDSLDDNSSLSGFTEHTVLDHVNPPFMQDPDAGPFTAWWWAYRGSVGNYVTYSDPQTAHLRRVGYVMFDQDRLRRRNMLRSDAFEPDVYYGRDARPPTYLAKLQKRLESHVKRSEIYDRGGRGYWAEGDESGLIWGFEAPVAGLKYTLSEGKILDHWYDGVLVDRLRLCWDDYRLSFRAVHEVNGLRRPI